MRYTSKNIILAEDDEDDSLFFEEALKAVEDPPSMIRVKDGVELSILLHSLHPLPDIVFLDLNMPRKNGAQCLAEIREDNQLQHLPVVVLSTTSTRTIVDAMYESGANLYIQKPSDLKLWTQAIAKVLHLDWNIHPPYSVKENFTLTEF